MLAQWVEWTAESRRQREVCTRLLQRMRQAAVASAFDTWAERMETTRRHTVLVGRMLQRMSAAALWSCFSTWQEVAAEQRRVAALMARVAARFTLRVEAAVRRRPPHPHTPVSRPSFSRVPPGRRSIHPHKWQRH